MALVVVDVPDLALLAVDALDLALLLLAAVVIVLAPVLLDVLDVVHLLVVELPEVRPLAVDPTVSLAPLMLIVRTVLKLVPALDLLHVRRMATLPVTEALREVKLRTTTTVMRLLL